MSLIDGVYWDLKYREEERNRPILKPVPMPKTRTELAPCPLCGGELYVLEMSICKTGETTVKCCRCMTEFHWENDGGETMHKLLTREIPIYEKETHRAEQKPKPKTIVKPKRVRRKQ